MKIEKIKKLKSGKYKLELDDKSKIITYDDVILNNNLLFNKNLSNEVYNKLNIDTKFYDIYNKAIKYISIKMRSKLEMQKYLEKLSIDEKEKQTIIDNLTELNFINDLNFTKAFISDKINLSNMGPYNIKKELLEHEIDLDVIDNELQKYSQTNFITKINNIITKKLKNTKYSGYILKQKIISELINLGYEKEMIYEQLSNFEFDDNDALKKEFNKTYKLLSKKYKDLELQNKIINKLYQKGYNLDEIKNLIKKG
ncbi:MAG: RecX family transcriptional regulator [Bacilli bacterium]|nr:RecX family transcriptional regulator [Bacilli bacterium]